MKMASGKVSHSQWCSAVNCNNCRKKIPGLSFFRFPLDPERSKQWVLNTGREDLLNKTAETLYNGNVLCAAHFEPDQFVNPYKKNRLIKDAVPTVFDIKPITPRRQLSRQTLVTKATDDSSKEKLLKKTVMAKQQLKNSTEVGTTMKGREGEMKVDVILPAAGTSERMKLPTAKQFLKVLGKHIIAYTVDSFHRLSWVRHVVVVVNADQIEFTQALMESYGFCRVIVCAGSVTRHRSIHCGVKALRAECLDSDVVIIHDAARPFVPEGVASSVAKAAESFGAAGVTRPLVSTVIRGDNDDHRLAESLDRERYRNSEMPQAFQYSVISSAYEKCTEHDLDHGTECLLLAMKYSGCRANLVEGTDDLWKVTYQKDLYSMESIVKEKLTVVSIVNCCLAEFPAVQDVWDRLHLAQLKVASGAEEPANTFLVILDSQSDSASILRELPSKIAQRYNDLPYSAVGLDLMVVVVFVWDSYNEKQAQTFSDDNTCQEEQQYGCQLKFKSSAVQHLSMSNARSSRTHSLQSSVLQDSQILQRDHSSRISGLGDANAQPSSQQYVEKDGTTASLEVKSEPSFEDASPPPAQQTRNTQLDSSLNTKTTTTIKSEPLETSLDPESMRIDESDLEVSHRMETELSVKPEPLPDWDEKLNSKLEINMNENNSTANESAVSGTESQRMCSVSTVDQPPHLPLRDSRPVKCRSENLTNSTGNDVHDVNERCQENFGDHTYCAMVIKDVKNRLIEDSNGKPACVVGVSCKRQSFVGEQLAELIWHRSSCLDGQVLMYSS